MPNIYDLAERFRSELLAGEKARALDITNRYGAAYKRIQARLKALSGLIDAREETGGAVSLSWLQSEARYRELIQQIDAELARFAPATASQIESGTQDATGLAGEGAVALLKEIDSTYNRLPVSATEFASGFVADGTPLSDLLLDASKEGAEKAKQAIVTGLVVGSNPRQTALNVQEALGSTLTRALTISRTETMRAYRAASIAQYKTSSVVTGWEWICTKRANTCPACLALDGRLFPLEEPFGSHPRCRCTSLPAFEGSLLRETGAEWFAKQDDATQEYVLGPGGFLLYKEEGVPLTAFIHESESPAWGITRTTKSLTAIRAELAIPAPIRRAQDPPSPSDPGKGRFPRPSKTDTIEQVRQKVLTAHAIYDARVQEVDAKIQALETARDSAPNQKAEDRAVMRLYGLETRRLALEAERQDRVSRLLAAPNPAEITPNFDRVPARIRDDVQAGFARFSRYVDKSVLPDSTTINVVLGKKLRSEYNPITNALEIGTGSHPSDALHELGHWFESNVPGAYDKAAAFHERRTAGEPITTVRSHYRNLPYAADELTKADAFFEPYVGRMFAPGVRATEVTTMMVQFVAEDGRAAKDADHFSVVFGMLRGIVPIPPRGK